MSTETSPGVINVKLAMLREETTKYCESENQRNFDKKIGYCSPLDDSTKYNYFIAVNILYLPCIKIIL